MEDSIFGPTPAKHLNLDNIDFDFADSNDNIPSNIEIPDVENLKLSRKKKYNKLDRNDLIKLQNFITM